MYDLIDDPAIALFMPICYNIANYNNNGLLYYSMEITLAKCECEKPEPFNPHGLGMSSTSGIGCKKCGNFIIPRTCNMCGFEFPKSKLNDGLCNNCSNRNEDFVR